MSRYITTTLPYVNGDPHIGFALEVVQADALARLWRASSPSVFFLTGVDEHGQKILEAAKKENKDVHNYVNYYANEFEKLKTALNLSYDHFVRTTSSHHYQAAQEMWRRCEANGDIYKKSYTGKYCIGCEAFKTEHEIVDGHCILHPTLEIQELSEENYFFKLSKYSEKLLNYLRREGSVIPSWRKEEAIAFVEAGLDDVSISREKARLSWGIPVPGDDTQVMYVWFDALTGYLSALGWPDDPDGNFELFWNEGETFQMAGKDQVRFQSILWQAVLSSAGIKHTDHVFYHGFINSGGQRMSKSSGNSISPFEMVQKYGTDATRYILLRHVHPIDDSDVTWERLDEWYTANLVNGLGNLVARVMKLSADYNSPLAELAVSNESLDFAFTEKIEQFRFNEALDFIFDMIAACDAVMTEREPFKKVKSQDEGIVEEGKKDIELLVQHLLKIGWHLGSLMPHTSEAVLNAVRENKKPENLFPRLT